VATTSWDVLDVSVATTQVNWDVLDVTVVATPLVQIQNPERPFPEPFETVSLEAAPQGEGYFTSWTWSVELGSATLSPSDDSVTFQAPATQTGTTVRIGVIGHYGAVNSKKATIDIVVPPHQYWLAVAGLWVPIVGPVQL
jgi:hypothetical protein